MRRLDGLQFIFFVPVNERCFPQLVGELGNPLTSCQILALFNVLKSEEFLVSVALMSHSEVDGRAIASGGKHEFSHVPWDVQFRFPLKSCHVSLGQCFLSTLVVLSDSVLSLVHAPCFTR